ncbi:phenylacetate-CoA oxygenase [Aneurinibacillus migulanus]|uniref:1,2-phenylacetyl-CoA epoxidase subunit PaaB n=1 Tax=Aneurinibacillus migulanus TaxID=47500 RepID=UPI0005BBFB75|nr:1,2-phenylacetyl-CoA epoxidase subunit PaaB [Aneurinibacillus migulanus]KIV53844.1 phenylacetate-CoA oxygenase [Aneurinibacillus migulanus]KPD08193.1 phenylacetate-CoA oxygenase [Aneurinibacillus migulanus]MED4731223.1 1,2-phenylacetyl-CoA epoxidase subunit B [Aneurinibacillus migulanus]CEH30500.1 Phenylacetate-CoA oxygenase, PaaH subunit [Aneurinibacillus migulanus]
MKSQLHDKKEFSIYEVFSQKNPTSGFVHQFSLLASDHEVAMTMARENFLRREPVVNIWVVKREDIYVLPPEERQYLERLDNKAYRETKGYGELPSKWRYHKEQYEKQSEVK